jgi:hypothetical protein
LKEGLGKVEEAGKSLPKWVGEYPRVLSKNNIIRGGEEKMSVPSKAYEFL